MIKVQVILWSYIYIYIYLLLPITLDEYHA